MCKFCDEFEMVREVRENSEFKYSYSVALLSHVIIDRKMRGRTTHFRKNGVGFKLNFCPECGKKF